MPFTRPSLDTIFGRMKADLEQRLGTQSWLPSSVLLVLLAVFAGSIYLAYGFLIKLSKELFFTTADEFLDWHAQLWGLPRKAAVKSTCNTQFTIEDGLRLIPANTEIESDGVSFLTYNSNFGAAGTYNVLVTAKIAGVEGNVDVDTFTIITPIEGVSSDVEPLDQPAGGTAEETNDELVARLLQRTRNPPGSGNPGDYQRWALEISGVGRTWVFSSTEWQGAGTVGVIISSSSLEIVDTAVRTAVVDYIETKRPVGADVDVADPVPVAVGFDISITPDTQDIRDEIDGFLNEYFLVSSEPGGTLKISQIRGAIDRAAVTDFEITEIRKDLVAEGSIGNITSTGLELLGFDVDDTAYTELT